MEPTRYDLALEEARRSIDRQAGNVARIRERTTNLVMVGGLAAAFIGGLAIRDDAPLTVWTVLGAAAFAGLLVVAVVVSAPRKFVFTNHAEVLVDWANRDDVTVARMVRNLAIHTDRHYRENARRVNRLNIYYGIDLLLLVLEVGLLLVDLRGR